ncbi:MAG: helix-turn-helix domain-containing protein [Ferrovum myxofaciens]|uniref:hypothetical protein n=1 Tax=Ferrovum myxofaciens TaxID=416213 RepID=UPI002352EF46|nr:hypothetical protein [Ferrovum myxofaciens]QKE40709.1 MAG: helix-turn-helix domain-containing protein [Ferrovum myxofaciens]
MKPNDPNHRDRWAQLRFAIIGPLFASPPADGELSGKLNELASRTWAHPVTGLPVRFGLSTIERWYYRARREDDPVGVLKNRPGSHFGTFPCLALEVREQLVGQYQEHPGWTVKLHHDNLISQNRENTLEVPSYPTIRRFLRSRGLFRAHRPKRQTPGALAAQERLEQRENLATQAWVEQEYNRTLHSEIRCTPMERYLQAPQVGRPSPSAEELECAFRLKVSRKQRRCDGTLMLEGQRFEIPSRYRNLETVHLRYARWDLSRVDMMDPRNDQILCAIHPLNNTANASGNRRRFESPGPSLSSAPATGMAPLLRELMAEYAASGLPPAYLPTEEEQP